MRTVLRLFLYIASAFALLVVGVAWYTFAQSDSARSSNTNGNMSRISYAPHGANETRSVSEEETEFAPPSLNWAKPQNASGYTAAEKLSLRSGPDALASVVAVLDFNEYGEAEILETKGDRLRVRYLPNVETGGARDRVYEGWVGWGEVLPYASALVLDAESGDVVARVPLNPGITSVAFSHDGKRAVFYSDNYNEPHRDGPTFAVEFDMEEFKIVRALETTAAGGFSSLRFQKSGELRVLAFAPGRQEDRSDWKLHDFRVGADKIEREEGGELTSLKGDVVFSRDGRKAFVLHNFKEVKDRMRVDVFDAETFEALGSFEAAGEGANWGHEYAFNYDGSEFFYKDGTGRRIVVVNTHTGERVRESPLQTNEDDWMGFWRNSLVGDSLLLRRWRMTEESEPVSESFWLKPNGESVPAESGVDFAIETKEALYAVNDTGTRLFKLDSDGGVRKRFEIARPETKFNESAPGEQHVMNFSASPDGKYLMLVFGLMNGC